MNIHYINHSCFLVETTRHYYLFDYQDGILPNLDIDKQIYVLSSHSHADHYNQDIFKILQEMNMKHIKAILSDDIETPIDIDTLHVSSHKQYQLDHHLILTTYQSTDLGVAFLIEDEEAIIYHAGDLNDWRWDEESDEYNKQMVLDYQKEIKLLADYLNNRIIDVSFVVLDPRQEQYYDKGLCYFLEHICSKKVYPMHYWNQPSIIDQFLIDHSQYKQQIYKGE